MPLLSKNRHGVGIVSLRLSHGEYFSMAASHPNSPHIPSQILPQQEGGRRRLAEQNGRGRGTARWRWRFPERDEEELCRQHQQPYLQQEKDVGEGNRAEGSSNNRSGNTSSGRGDKKMAGNTLPCLC